MLRNFGISLLMFGLLLAGIEGFRVREGTAAAPSGSVHMAEGGVGLGPIK